MVMTIAVELLLLSAVLAISVIALLYYKFLKDKRRGVRRWN
jgi:hypothetical protein